MGKITCLEEGFAEINGLVKCCPKLEHSTCKKLSHLIKELEFKVKICKEWEELKCKEEELKCKLEMEAAEVKIKIHAELEEIKRKKKCFELELHEEAEDLKFKAEVIAQELNPVDKIKFGFLKFKAHFEAEKEHYEKLIECHKPKFLIFSCCDSRVDPYKILNLELGEAIVVRNVGGLVTPCGEEGAYPSCGASIEYAVKELKVEHIFVIGHSESVVKEEHCEHESLKCWLKLKEHVHQKVKEVHEALTIEEKKLLVVKESINSSLHNLLSYSFVKEGCSQKKISLHGGFYDLHKCTFDHWSFEYKHTESEYEYKKC